ncbi:hypothetical protein QMA71_17855 [Pseudomonas otitidis]|uniref:hypothetical protein n=1 Tax=Metapseudomonas otitidis TaxID=319939 RepID=UPI0024AD1106|nr:hypothetical protein [Pseudomonas otitidis]MDI6527404.1 hypothetical protein [Pseudomonas otitidis]
MKALVDRPRSPTLTIEEGKGAGKTVSTSYAWGDDSDLLPVKVRLFVTVDGREKWIDEVEGPFASFDEADAKALRAASDWYDRGNG